MQVFHDHIEQSSAVQTGFSVLLSHAVCWFGYFRFQDGKSRIELALANPPDLLLPLLLVLLDFPRKESPSVSLIAFHSAVAVCADNNKV